MPRRLGIDAPWEGEHLTLRRRVEAFLERVPVIRVEQIANLLGEGITREGIRKWIEMGTVHAEGRGRDYLLWRPGFVGKPPLHGTFPEVGWHPFLGPLAMASLKGASEKILLGEDFQAWARSEYGESVPAHWSAEHGGLGAGMMVGEDRLGAQRWTLVTKHRARFGSGCAFGLLDDLGGMLVKRADAGLTTRVHLMIGFESLWARPGHMHGKAILKRYRDVLNSNAIAYNRERTRSARLNGVEFSFGVIGGVGAVPGAWKFWEVVIPHRNRNHGAHFGVVGSDEIRRSG